MGYCAMTVEGTINIEYWVGVVFKSLVQSGFLTLFGLDWDWDQSSLFRKGLDHGLDR